MSGGSRPTRRQSWLCTATGLPGDVLIVVGDMSINLHKFPLMSKSRKLHRLITELQHEDDGNTIILPVFPGGLNNLEDAAKFCYGMKMELTPWNAAPLRCAAEYLEMTDDFSDDNLASRTDLFLTNSVLSSLRNSIHALKSCENLLPLAEDLGIVQSCLDSIAARACSADPGTLLLSWPARSDDPPPLLWNGIDAPAPRHGRKSSSSSSPAAASWLDDLADLTLPFYKRVVAAMRAADPSSEALEASLVAYATRSIPGLSRSGWKHASAPGLSEAEQREVLEIVVTSQPPDETVAGLTTARFLSRLLRTAGILRASEASRAALERRIASQLEHATVNNLLIPSYSGQVDETLYDVGCVERILRHFLEGLQQGPVAPNIIIATEEEQQQQQGGARARADRLARVGRLVDDYLAEIAPDGNLKPGKFCDLALALPEDARVHDDGLYRAVDKYLKEHPEMTEEERDLVCGVMDFNKLTPKACEHAAQNERLPMRLVVKALFFQQMELRQAIGGRPTAAGAQQVEQDMNGGAAAARENQVLRLDMDSMRNRVQELEMECSGMRRKMERIERGEGRWGSFTKKMGCGFKTQVHEPNRRNSY